MANNKYPWLRNIFGAKEPLIIMGKVQAGTTAAIKRGEICTFNETSGYFIPVNAAADYVYSLAIANEEQKADGLARYMEFLAIRDGDVFEFELAAAAQIEYGYALELTASNSQKLTYDADGNAVAFVAGHQNYPETGTTLRTVSHAEVCFLPEYSYIYKNMIPKNLKKLLVKTDAYTLTLEDCGAVLSTKGDSDGVALTAPSGTVPIGWWIDIFVGADQAVTFDPKPDTAKIYVAGAAQTAGKYMSMTDIGDFVRLMWDGTDWLATSGLSGADGDISIQG